MPLYSPEVASGHARARRSSTFVWSALLLLLLLPWTHLSAQHYQVGGSQDFAESLQRQLNERVDLIRLGLNTDRLMGAGLDPELYMAGVIGVADGVRRGQYPGAVLHVDAFWSDNVPVGVGYMMSDPERHPADWGTQYEIGSLTGIVVVTPLLLRAVERGDVTLMETAGDYIPELAGSRAGDLRIGVLMRHVSGLPVSPELPGDVRSREAMLAWLRDVPLDFEPGTRVQRSPLNFMLLGLVLEKEYGAPVQQLADAHYMQALGMSNTTGELPAQLRSRVAPGNYSEWLGRMAWGEACDPTAFVLGTSAGHGGLITGPDDLDTFSRALIAAYTVGLNDLVTTATMEASTQPLAGVAGGESQGLGWQLGGLGPGSFGWECPITGSAIWIQPATQIFVVVLANAHHPDSHPERFEAARRLYLKCVQAAMPVQAEEARATPESDRLRMEMAVRLNDAEAQASESLPGVSMSGVSMLSIAIATKRGL
ncbi:MAG: hypothetical protein PWP23_3041 [Candidatus Sumerlaeota bacterium]|nr:hypothetical protein [Candidatus Sumerlaeota bacterium]